MGSKEISYTSASSLPLKIILDKELVKSIREDKKILPRHINLNPENKCTQDCDWCSCSNRDKTLEMPYETVIDTMKKFKSLGAKGCTLTGGGELLCHPKANEIINGIYDLGIDVGMVTNADLIKRLKKESLDKLTWMRISLGDGKKIGTRWWSNLEEVIGIEKNVDFSFSYVADSNNPNYKLINKMVNFANDFDFTHIRLVNNIFTANNLSQSMKNIKSNLIKSNIDDSKVIYQDRGIWTRGTKKCLISLLKPTITADGKLGACCGEQYMTNPPKRDYIGDFGTIEDIDKIWKEQKHYNGEKCVKCYYSNYNTLLSTLSEGIKHKNFV